MKKLFLLLAVCFAGLVTSAQEKFDMPNATGTYLTGINDSGEICGYYTVASGNTIAFWINKYGDTIVLHGPGGSNSYVNATGISNNDMVVGNFGTAGNVSAAQSFIFLPNPGRNSGGTYLTVTNWGGTNTQASGITSDTCISGSYQVGGNDCGALWCTGAGTPTSLRCSNVGTVYPTYAFDINTVNHNACGFIIQGAEEQAFVYRSSIDAWDTFQVGGFLKSRALGMNDNGWICGNYNNETKGFYGKKVWQQNLTNFTQIIVNGATTIYPSHINNANGIVGYYTDAQGVDHGFILATYDIGFRPSVNGYNFPNTDTSVWWPSYYNQWSYELDPYLNNNTSFPLNWVNEFYSSKTSFPSWPHYVVAFPATRFYKHVGFVIVRNQLDFNRWVAEISPWGGSCYGFAVSAGLIFDNAAKLDASYPSYLPYHGQNLFDYPLNDTTITVINKVFTRQYAKELMGLKTARLDSNISVNLQLIQQELRNSRGRYHSGMSIRDQHQPGGHAIFPYKLVPGATGDGIDTIYVYDCNFPGNDTLYMTVDLNAGNGGDWSYDARGLYASDFGGSPNGKGFAPYGPDSMALNQLHIGVPGPAEGPLYNRSTQAQPFETMFNDSSVVHMVDDSGNVAVFSIDSTRSTNLIDPWDVPGGRGPQQVKATYNQGNVTAITKTNNGNFANNFVLVTSDNYLIRCDRPSANAGTDHYSASPASLTYLATDSARMVNYTVNIDNDTSVEYNYYITQLNVPGANKVTVSVADSVGVLLQNFGPATSYVITTNFVKTDTIVTFTDTIAIQGNTQHTILPHDTTYSGIFILVDTGMTGNIEDSIFIHRTVTGINRVNAPNITAWPVPSADALYMSGPQGLVSYKIIDAMGRIVGTGQMDFGTGTTQMFNLARYAPGLYTIAADGPQGKWNYLFMRQ